MKFKEELKGQKTVAYGCERLGRLRSVMLHRPGKALELINEGNYRRMLFDKVPDVCAYIEDHDRYREKLRSFGVEVLELGDFVFENRGLMDRMANLTFLHDTAVISKYGAILSRMAFEGREDEHVVVREALENIGIPIFLEFTDEGDFFEGCLLVSDELIVVAETERHSRQAVLKFICHMKPYFKEIVYVEVPKERRYMHPDTIFNRARCDLAVAYLPVFEKSFLFTDKHVVSIDFDDFVRRRGIDVISISDAEQRRLGCSFVPLDNGVIMHYDTALDKTTQRQLAEKGVELVLFQPKSLGDGGGSLRCHTLRIKRD